MEINKRITSEIDSASVVLNNIVLQTPLQYNARLSEHYEANIYLKREDLQEIRSFKIRGAYNKISQLTPQEKELGVICASAGNHAQGVALSCKTLGIHGKIFMPSTTPKQKVKKVKFFGRDMVEVVLIGDTYDDAFEAAMEVQSNTGSAFVHPFDDEKVIAGQGTIAKEILAQISVAIDYCIYCVGGGGLGSGLSAYFSERSPSTKLIGAEPKGAPSMTESITKGHLVALDAIDPFVDGAAVKKVGELTFKINKENMDNILLIDEGKLCDTILEMYNEDAIVLEPAGGLALATLDQIKDDIKGKNVVCVVSGGNNDITRMEEFKEKALIYRGLKHYFIITFPQRAGALRDFLNLALGPDDDITLFQYTKKTSRESGPALVGIELQRAEDYAGLLARMEEQKINYILVNKDQRLFDLLI